MPDLTLDQFRAGLHRAAQRRRADDLRSFGPPRHVQAVPDSTLPDDLRAELDAVACATHADNRASPWRREPTPEAKAALHALVRG